MAAMHSYRIFDYAAPATSPAPMPVPAKPPYMRLAGESPEPQGAERRVFARKQVEARVQGKRLDHTIDARRQPFLNLQLRDVSVGGVAAISQSAISPGERIGVFFPPEGTKRGWDAYGRVIRCDPSQVGNGYRIAVEFEAIPLAA